MQRAARATAAITFSPRATISLHPRPPRAQAAPKRQANGQNGALHGDAPADPVRLHEAVPRPRPTRTRVTNRYCRYPRDSVPAPPADCPLINGPAVTAFRDSVAVDDINGTITATDARGRVHTFYRVACAETRPAVSSLHTTALV